MKAPLVRSFGVSAPSVLWRKLVLAGMQMATPGELAEKAHLTVLLNNLVLIAYAEEHLVEIRQRFLPMVPSSDAEMKEHT